jgi:hypothetical protein
MKVLPKQRLQSKPPLSQKSVVVMLELEDVELSESVEGAKLPELIVGAGLSEVVVDVEAVEPEPWEGHVSSPCWLSPGL